MSARPLTLLCAAWIAWASAPALPQAADEVAGLAEAQAFYAGRPRVERPQAGWQAVPEELRGIRAKQCGVCHRAIYKEWRVSTHAMAWSDRQFQAEREKSGNRWLCSNCHTPLLNQMEEWAVGLEGDDVERPRYVANPAWDEALRDEGITCAGCHVRDGVVEGPTGIVTERHPTRKSERFTNGEICLTCHQAVRIYPGKDFLCTFETGDEWAASPYGQQGQNCTYCHMPPVTRKQAVTAKEERPGRHHFWPGAGIYKVEGVGPPLDLLGPGLGVEVAADPAAGELVVALSNAVAGHLLPTGDPERFIQVEVEFLDAAGARVGEPWRERIGQSWEWYPEPRKLGDNRLAPLEVRESRLPLPAGAAAWRLTASSHRIGREALEYHDLEGYPASRVTHRLDGALP